MKFLAATMLAIFAANAHADTFAVIDGKQYDLKEREQPDCSSEPDVFAMKFRFNAAYESGKKFAEQACVTTCSSGSGQNCEQFCQSDADQVKKNQQIGLKAVFAGVRRYPPFYKNEFCAQGRKVCEDLCISLAVFEDKLCAVECNQYESFYAK